MNKQLLLSSPATRYAAWRGDAACGGPLTRSIRLGLSLPLVGLAAMHSCSQTGILNGSATPPGKKKKKKSFLLRLTFRLRFAACLTTAEQSGAYQRRCGFVPSLWRHCCQVGKSLFPRALVPELSPCGRFSKTPSPASA